MKLPIYERQVGAPGAPSPGGLPYASAFGAGLQDIARGADRLAAGLYEVEQKAERARQAVEAAKLSADFAGFLASESDKLGPDVGDAETNEKAFRSAGEEWIAGRVKAIQNPEFRQHAEAALIGKLTTETTQARKTALGRIIERTRSEAFERLDALRQRGTLEARQEALAFSEGLTVAGIFTAKEGEAERQLVVRDSLANWFARELDADPRATLAQIDTNKVPFPVTDEQRKTMRAGAVSRIEREEAKAQAAENARLKAQADEEKRLEKEMKRDQEATEDALRQKMRRGESIAAELEFMGSSGTRELSPEGQRRLIQESDARTADRKVESVAATVTEASIRARSVRVSPTDRTWLRAQLLAGKLSVADFDKYDDKMVQNLKSGEDETKAQVNDRHQQAEQRVRAGLGITGLLDMVDQGRQKAYDLALEELTNRSARYDGTEDPLSVADEIIPKYKAYIGGDTTLSREGLARAAKALDAQYQQGLIPEGRYRAERSRLLDMVPQAPVETPPAPQSSQSPRRR